MTRSTAKYLLFFIFMISFKLMGQTKQVRIDVHLLGYDGYSAFQYYFENGNYLRNPTIIYPDRNGKATINVSIDSIHYFWFSFRNQGDKDHYYECKLIVEPGKHYSIISNGAKWTWPKPENYFSSPDIYTYSLERSDQQTMLSLDYCQMYYNMFDDNTMGSLYFQEWNLKHPDSLIINLQERIRNRISLLEVQKRSGRISNEVFEIMEANVEYLLAYQLAQTIQDTWKLERFMIEDESIKYKLAEVYDSIFILYPVSDERLKFFNLSERYVGAYLYHYESKKKGSYSAPMGASYTKYIDEIKPFINSEVYKNCKLQYTMAEVLNMELETSVKAKEFLEENPEMKSSQWGIITEEMLIPRALHFDSLASRPRSDKIMVLDNGETINSFQKLTNVLKGKSFVIDFWGSWCSPCRAMFHYKDSLKHFLDVQQIEMVYAAYEYNKNRDDWMRIITAYQLEGYHLMIGREFLKNLENDGIKIKGFPTYMLVDSSGVIVEANAFFPDESEKLKAQIKQLLIP